MQRTSATALVLMEQVPCWGGANVQDLLQATHRANKLVVGTRARARHNLTLTVTLSVTVQSAFFAPFFPSAVWSQAFMT